MIKNTFGPKTFAPQVAVTPEIQFMEDVAPKRMTVLVYGMPGAGKTHFAGTFPKPLFLDMRGGLETVRKKKVAYYRPKTIAEIISFANPETLKDFRTIVLDHLTEMTRLLMADILAVSGREHAQLQDWGMLLERIRRIVVTFTDPELLPDHHVVFIAEEHYKQDEATGALIGGPAVDGKMFGQIGSWFDCVFHIHNTFNPSTKTRERFLQTEPDSIYKQIKSRFAGLEKLEKPDFPSLWAKITKED